MCFWGMRRCFRFQAWRQSWECGGSLGGLADGEKLGEWDVYGGKLGR